MLFIIGIVLVVLWLIGWLGFRVLGAAVHLLIFLAIVFFVIALLHHG